MNTKEMTNEEISLMGKYVGTVSAKGCCNCGKTGTGTMRMIVPTQLGGRVVLSNMYFVCSDCLLIEEERKYWTRLAIREGMAKAKEEGRPVGRKKKTAKQLPKVFKNNYKKLYTGELTKTRLAEIVGVSRPTLDRYIKIMENKR